VQQATAASRGQEFLIAERRVISELSVLRRRNHCPAQGEEGPQSGSIGRGWVELHAGGKHSRLMEAFKDFSLEVSALSSSVSFSICSLSFLTCKISFSICSLSFLTRKISFSICAISLSSCFERCSISRTGRQLSIDNHERHGGSDPGDAPLLLEVDAASAEGDVVIGGEQRNQADGDAAQGLEEPEAIKAGPAARGWVPVCRDRSVLAAA
jgi:hypothetical protein